LLILQLGHLCRRELHSLLLHVHHSVGLLLLLLLLLMLLHHRCLALPNLILLERELRVCLHYKVLLLAIAVTSKDLATHSAQLCVLAVLAVAASAVESCGSWLERLALRQPLFDHPSVLALPCLRQGAVRPYQPDPSHLHRAACPSWLRAG
jgi:hypothetical protein